MADDHPLALVQPILRDRPVAHRVVDQRPRGERDHPGRAVGVLGIDRRIAPADRGREAGRRPDGAVPVQLGQPRGAEHRQAERHARGGIDPEPRHPVPQPVDDGRPVVARDERLVQAGQLLRAGLLEPVEQLVDDRPLVGEVGVDGGDAHPGAARDLVRREGGDAALLDHLGGGGTDRVHGRAGALLRGPSAATREPEIRHGFIVPDGDANGSLCYHSRTSLPMASVANPPATEAAFCSGRWRRRGDAR